MNLSPELTSDDVVLLRIADTVTNVYEREYAERYRDLAARHPNLVELLEPQGAFGPQEEIPFFAVRVTTAGQVNHTARVLMVLLTTMDVRQFYAELVVEGGKSNWLFWLTDPTLIAEVQALVNKAEVLEQNKAKEGEG